MSNATETTRERIESAEDLIARITAAIEIRKQQVEQGQATWSTAGDIGFVVQELEEVARFLRA